MPRQVVYFGTNPPTRADLPDGVKDDAGYVAPQCPTVVGRLTVAKEFCADDIYGRAAQKAWALASMIFNTELQPKFVRTKCAINYESEITMCLIIKPTALDTSL